MNGLIAWRFALGWPACSHTSPTHFVFVDRFDPNRYPILVAS